jgi:dihydroorotate dehydrogenase electron transfer subunit
VLSPRVAEMPLSRRDDIGNGYHVLVFAPDEPIAGRAGHFTMMRSVSWGDAPLLPRPMSLLTVGAEPSILIKVVGEGTRRLALAAVGERDTLHAPLGKPWPMPRDGERVLLVAGGVGVAPLICLAEELSQRGTSVHSLYGGRTERDLPLSEKLERSGALGVTTEDGSRGTKGRITVLLAQELQRRVRDGVATRIYTCGPHAMMGAVAKMAADQGVPCEASLEAPMGCGYGVCLGCPAPKIGGGYLYTCVDGPCVDAAAIDWSRGVF